MATKAYFFTSTVLSREWGSCELPSSFFQQNNKSKVTAKQCRNKLGTYISSKSYYKSQRIGEDFLEKAQLEWEEVIGEWKVFQLFKIKG